MSKSTRMMSFAEALVDGLAVALRADSRVTLIGSYLLGLGPQRHHMDRLKGEFPDRLIDPPIAEAAIAGLGAGAAMAGGRPFVDFTTASFSLLAWSQITNEAAVARLMSGGQISVPVVYHMLHGVRGGGAAQHSTSPQAMLWNSPGLYIVLPSSPRDVKGLVRRALKEQNPTVILNHAKLMGVEEEVEEGDFEIGFGVADIKRRGRDVTIVATSYMVQVALAAARRLSTQGIEAEVVDPRSLVPFDEVTLLDSVQRTGRVVIVDECPLRCGVAAEITAIIAENAYGKLKAPPLRVTRADSPIPSNLKLEALLVPDEEKVIAAVHRVMGRKPQPGSSVGGYDNA